MNREIVDRVYHTSIHLHIHYQMLMRWRRFGQNNHRLGQNRILQIVVKSFRGRSELDQVYMSNFGCIFLYTEPEFYIIWSIFSSVVWHINFLIFFQYHGREASLNAVNLKCNVPYATLPFDNSSINYHAS